MPAESCTILHIPAQCPVMPQCVCVYVCACVLTDPGVLNVNQIKMLFLKLIFEILMARQIWRERGKSKWKTVFRDLANISMGILWGTKTLMRWEREQKFLWISLEVKREVKNGILECKADVCERIKGRYFQMIYWEIEVEKTLYNNNKLERSNYVSKCR